MLKLLQIGIKRTGPILRSWFLNSYISTELKKLREAGVSDDFFHQAAVLYPDCKKQYWQEMTGDLIALYKHVPDASSHELKSFIWGTFYFRNLKIPQAIPELMEAYGMLTKTKKRRVDPYEINMFTEAAKQRTKEQRGIIKLAEQLIGYIEEGRPPNNYTGIGSCWALIPAASAPMGYFD